MTMITSRLTTCKTCAEVPRLLAAINCRIAIEASKIHSNLTLMLNAPIDGCLIGDLMHYKRIITWKFYSPDYACGYTLEQIASKIRQKTVGVNTDCKSTVSLYTPPINN